MTGSWSRLPRILAPALGGLFALAGCAAEPALPPRSAPPMQVTEGYLRAAGSGHCEAARSFWVRPDRAGCRRWWQQDWSFAVTGETLDPGDSEAEVTVIWEAPHHVTHYYLVHTPDGWRIRDLGHG